MKCLICGKEFKRVCGHVRQVHDMSAREYKQEFGFDVKRGLISEKDRQIMADHTRSNGTIENLKLGKQFRFKKGHKINYKRSLQTLERLRTLQQDLKKKAV